MKNKLPLPSYECLKNDEDTDIYYPLQQQPSMDSVWGVVVFFPGPNAASLSLRVLGIVVSLKVRIQSPLFIGCMVLVTSKTLLLHSMAGRVQKGFEKKRKGNTGASKQS